ncbi:hypothetical protein [Aeromonas caviae]|uniref:hypothetical protein n=1 Tax=Aeromonas caviae TaxID=648 RepID=UPI002282039F|nr:hypothetical protein [Aeromonas caviae]MCY9811369.1 hypothetical protein [Aeromonas caviae]
MGSIKDEVLIDREQQKVLNEFDRSSPEFKLPKKLAITGSRLEIIGEASTDISSIKSSFSNELFTAFVSTIAALFKGEALSNHGLLNNQVSAFRRYIELTGTKEITVESLSLLLDKCRSHEAGHSDYGHVKSLLTQWHRLNFPGVTDDIIDFFGPIQSPKPKRPSGSRVRSDDPMEGWYTDTEYNSLVEAIWQGYESGTETLWRATALLLSAQYGRRPVQLAHLKIGDLKSVGECCGVSGRRIEFPGVKDKGTGGFRQSKIEVHPISNELWQLCQLQAADSTRRFEEHFGRQLSLKEKRLLPLFPARSTPSFIARIEDAQYLSETTEDLLSSPALHSKSYQISATLQEGPRGEPVISERTGQPLVQYAYRFRYTRARQLARLGVPRAILQYWLGHETKFSLEAYYDDPAERARALNNQISPIMAPLAQAFQGILRDSEADAERGNDPNSRIELDGMEELGVGTCGEHGFCSASVPLPCYRCTKFQPWVYGPHHEVLNRLLERQKLENDVPIPGQHRRLLVPVQLDKDIQAVRAVIALCEARKTVLEGADE